MIQDLKPYPVYKDSGVPWLGEVPEHWEVVPHRAVFSEVKERDHSDEQMLSVTITQGVIKQRALLEGSSKKDSSNQDKSAYKLVCPGDIAYNKMRAWQGAVRVSDFRGIVSPAYVVVRLRNENNPRYFHHLFRTPGFTKEAERWSYGITSDMWSLRPEHFKMIYGCLPPLSEQSAIVRYLDHIDRRIRRYIHAKQKLITLLEEQKQAIIHRAVTRGLDPNVRLKPSGVEWLGDVPEHWALVQLRRLVSFVTSGSRGWANFYSETGDIFLQSGNLGRSMSLNLSFIQHVQPPQGSEGERTWVRRDDVLVCITGALTGNVAHVNMDLPAPAFVNQHVALVRPRQAMVYPRYVAFALHAEIGRIQFKTGEYGGTKQGLGLGEDPEGGLLLERAIELIRILKPGDDAHRSQQNRALQIGGDLARARWLLIEQSGSSIPMAFLVFLIFWITMILASFGLFAPCNMTVVAALFVCSVSLAGSMFLILEMDTPLHGLIKISGAPLHNTLSHLNQ